MAKGYLYDNGDELITREDVNEVPDGSTSSAGDVLSLDSNKKPKWSTPESELPSTGSASEGDVLSLNSSKEPVWSTPSGGGGGIVLHIDFQNPTPITGTELNSYPVLTDNNVPFTMTMFSFANLPVLKVEDDGKNYVYTVRIYNPTGGELPGLPIYVGFNMLEGVTADRIDTFAASASSALVCVSE